MFSIALGLAAIQAGPPPAAEPAPVPMTLETVRDPIDDSLRATAVLRGDGERLEISCRAPGWGEVKVAYRSRHWIARGNFLTGQQPATYRFDDQPPVRGLWHVRGRIASIDEADRVIVFLEALMNAHHLVLRTRDVENRSFDAYFTIGETRGAITALLQSCGSGRIRNRLLGAG